MSARRDGEAGRRRLDPTRMADQPALRTSTGRAWIVMGGLFAAVSLVPFMLLIFAGSGRSRGLAIAVAVLMLILYALLVSARFLLRSGPVRLRTMAVCMLTMAAVALGGAWLCALIESAPG